MTVYVTAMPHEPNGYHLWADHPDEALAAAYACGSSLDDHRPDRSELHYQITWDQALAARALGAQVADKVAPMEAAARFNGNREALKSLATWRRELGQPRTGPRGKGPV